MLNEISPQQAEYNMYNPQKFMFICTVNKYLFVYEKTTKPIEAHRSNSFKVGEKQHEK